MSKIVKDILPTIINLKEWQINLLENWDTIVCGLNTKIKLEKIQNDVLVVGVYESCWMQELYMLTKTIVKSINKKLNGDFIKGIKFKLATQSKDNSLSQAPKKTFKPVKKLELTEDQKKALVLVEDIQLQQALLGFFNSCI